MTMLLSSGLLQCIQMVLDHPYEWHPRVLPEPRLQDLPPLLVPVGHVCVHNQVPVWAVEPPLEGLPELWHDDRVQGNGEVKVLLPG